MPRGRYWGCGATWHFEHCFCTVSTNAASGSVSGLPSRPRMTPPAGGPPGRLRRRRRPGDDGETERSRRGGPAVAASPDQSTTRPAYNRERAGAGASPAPHARYNRRASSRPPSALPRLLPTALVLLAGPAARAHAQAPARRARHRPPADRGPRSLARERGRASPEGRLRGRGGRSTSGSSRSGPRAPALRSNLGAAYAGLGRYDDAIEQYRRALATDGGNVAIRRNLALAYYKAGRLTEAAREAEKVLAAQPENDAATLLLADCRFRLGQNARVDRAPAAAGRPRRRRSARCRTCSAWRSSPRAGRPRRRPRSTACCATARPRPTSSSR